MMYKAFITQQEASIHLPSMHEWRFTLTLRAMHRHLINCRAHLQGYAGADGEVM